MLFKSTLLQHSLFFKSLSLMYSFRTLIKAVEVSEIIILMRCLEFLNIYCRLVYNRSSLWPEVVGLQPNELLIGMAHQRFEYSLLITIVQQCYSKVQNHPVSFIWRSSRKIGPCRSRGTIVSSFTLSLAFFVFFLAKQCRTKKMQWPSLWDS